MQFMVHYMILFSVAKLIYNLVLAVVVAWWCQTETYVSLLSLEPRGIDSIYRRVSRKPLGHQTEQPRFNHILALGVDTVLILRDRDPLFFSILYFEHWTCHPGDGNWGEQ